MPSEWLDWAESDQGWRRAEAEAEAECFADYWQAKAGKDGAKLDWFATWRNWVRNSRRKSNVPRGSFPAGHSGIPI